ncbi:MAG: site-specific integrase [Blautia sp.]|nr:site-specific integrase [Blautia sp.]
MKKNNLQPALRQFFEEYLPSTKGVSDNTIRSYRYTFRLLLQFLFEQHGTSPAKADFCDLEGDAVLEFLKWLEQTRECSAATRNQRLAAIRSFSRFSSHYCFQPSLAFVAAVSALPRKKTAKKTMAYMTKEEMSIVLSLPRNSTLAEKRDRVLLSVLYASGARAQELCDLRIRDVRFEKEKAHLLLNGKGKKSRIAVVPEDCTALLAHYMKRNHLQDHADSDRHLFSSQTHEHMTTSCVEGIVKKYIKQARELHPELFRENSYTPHSFRHSVAVHMLEAGIPLPVIKNFLGHSSLETTMVYYGKQVFMVSGHLQTA